MLRLNLHNFHHAPDDFAAGVPVGLVQSLADLLGELVQMAEHQPQVCLLRRVIRRLHRFLLEPLQPCQANWE
jgi:uncharacterized integral membrane protein